MVISKRTSPHNCPSRCHFYVYVLLAIEVAAGYHLSTQIEVFFNDTFNILLNRLSHSVANNQLVKLFARKINVA